MGGFGQIVKNMMTWTPPNSLASANRQRLQIQKAEADRAASMADLEFHQHMMEMGALPVVNGMVKEPESLSAPAPQAPDQSQGQPSVQSSGSSPQTAAPSDGTPVDPALTRGGDTPPPAPGGGSPVNSRQLLETMNQPGPSGDSSSMFDPQGNPNPSASFGTPPASQALMQAMMPGPQTGNLTIVRKADPANTVKWKDATGDQVVYELPTPESQRFMQMMRLRAQGLQQQTQAQEQGRLNAQNQQREQYGTPLSGDLADKYGVDPDQKFLPAEKVQLATRYFPVVGAGVRGDATKTAAQIRADATNYKTDLDSTTKQAIADQDSMDRQSLLTHRDQWNQAIIAAKNNGQGNLNARAFLNNSARDMALHTTLLGDISKESQRQMLASSVLAGGPDGQPVTKDGDTFQDPWSGKQMTMNSAQRIRLGSALRQSQTTVSGYQQAAADIESRRDQILNRFGSGVPSAPGGGVSFGSGAAAPGAGASGPSGVPAAPVGPSAPSSPASGPPSASSTSTPRTWAHAARADAGPAGLVPGRSGTPPSTAAPAAARPSAKIANQSQVNAYAKQKGITPAAALKEFQASGYTVQ